MINLGIYPETYLMYVFLTAIRQSSSNGQMLSFIKGLVPCNWWYITQLLYIDVDVGPPQRFQGSNA